MAETLGNLEQQDVSEIEVYRQLFLIEQRLVLSTAVLQEALHRARGGTRTSFVYKRLVLVCKECINKLEKERIVVLQIAGRFLDEF